MSASWPHTSGQNLQEPFDDMAYVNPCLLCAVLCRESSDRNSHGSMLPSETWNAEADSFYGFCPIPVARGAISPDTQAQELSLSFSLALVKVLLGEWIHAICIH